MKITNFTSVREVLHNNYWSHNVIDLYHFMGISPRNLTLFTRRFLAGRCTQARYKTMFIIPNGCVQIEPHHLYRLCSRFLFNFSIIYLGKLILQHNLFMLLRLHPRTMVAREGSREESSRRRIGSNLAAFSASLSSSITLNERVIGLI